jgi:hypothetical protein
LLLAIEALLLAGQLDQAFDIAAAKGQLQLFARLAADGAKVGPGDRALVVVVGIQA